jgi:hypothetical protein
LVHFILKKNNDPLFLKKNKQKDFTSFAASSSWLASQRRRWGESPLFYAFSFPARSWLNGVS